MENKNSKTSQILVKYTLYKTAPRKLILNFFLSRKSAIKLSDLYKSMDNKIDRSTIYRTITGFVKKGIIHIVPSLEGEYTYALNFYPTKNRSKDAVHFICLNCHKYYYFPELTIPEIILPQRLHAAHTEIIINGICDKCKA